VGTGLDTLNLLRPVTFEFKNATGTTHIGFIAEDVELVDPRLVSYGDDGLPQSVRYIEVIPLLTQAIQELNLNVNSIASTTATSTPASQTFASAFFSNFFGRVVTWLADATNGIGDFFANRIRTTELCVSDGGGETCITRAQLNDLLAGAGASAPPPPPEAPLEEEEDTEAPVITVVGNNPAEILVGDSYADLGATVTDNVSQNIGIHIYQIVEGQEVEVQTVTIDTSSAGEHAIIYRATDVAGNVGESTRTVTVLDPSATPEPQPEPEPQPFPEPEPAP
jgi:hypothetical protein